jgi:hypothetical protein
LPSGTSFGENEDAHGAAKQRQKFATVE